ncbi:hypothetical protein GQ53DRAFT_53943 [Thozetella sp. PMI_491]|nr:hypothetical protein GQ53DRAFT_53943 [Thozetella sp. PMI_491]
MHSQSPMAVCTCIVIMLQVMVLGAGLIGIDRAAFHSILIWPDRRSGVRWKIAAFSQLGYGRLLGRPTATKADSVWLKPFLDQDSPAQLLPGVLDLTSDKGAGEQALSYPGVINYPLVPWRGPLLSIPNYSSEFKPHCSLRTHKPIFSLSLPF